MSLEAADYFLRYLSSKGIKGTEAIAEEVNFIVAAIPPSRRAEYPEDDGMAAAQFLYETEKRSPSKLIEDALLQNKIGYDVISDFFNYLQSNINDFKNSFNTTIRHLQVGGGALLVHACNEGVFVGYFLPTNVISLLFDNTVTEDVSKSLISARVFEYGEKNQFTTVPYEMKVTMSWDKDLFNVVPIRATMSKSTIKVETLYNGSILGVYRTEM